MTMVMVKIMVVKRIPIMTVKTTLQNFLKYLPLLKTSLTEKKSFDKSLFDKIASNKNSSKKQFMCSNVQLKNHGVYFVRIFNDI